MPNNRLIVRMAPDRPTYHLQCLHDQYNACVAQCWDHCETVVLDFPNVATANAALPDYQEHPSTLYAQKDYAYHPATTTPNDPYFTAWNPFPFNPAANEPTGQWDLKLLKVPEAWDVTTGDALIKIGQIDSGFRPDHEDMVGLNYQWKDTSGENMPPGDAPGYHHGAYAAGITVARPNNNCGIAGIVWKCVFYVAKVYAWGASNTAPTATTSYIVPAIDWMISQGVWAYNLELQGFAAGDTAFHDAIKRSVASWCIPCTAAGNTDQITPPSYPGAWPECIATGNVDHSATIHPTSATGTYVAIACPGEDSITVFPEFSSSLATCNDPQRYTHFGHTSAAAAHLIGVVGLMLTMNATATPQEIRDALTQTATRGATQTVVPDTSYGYGIVHAGNAVKRICGR